MRTSPVKSLLAERGATFREISGREIASGFSSFEEEYRAVREGVGLTDFSFATKFRVSESALDIFERYAAGSVANIRFGRILHTMAVDEDGRLESELYIANDDDKLILIGEAIVPDDAVKTALLQSAEDESALEDLSESHALFGVDGFNAWAVVRELFGSDILGLPYMSIENYTVDGIQVKLFRAGKTSEFGYLLMTEASNAETLWQRIESAGEKWGLMPVGFDTHMALRLDGRFFNIHREGLEVGDPLPLGLQWMMDLEGEDYRGKAALMARRENGVSKKIIGVVTDGKDRTLKVGDEIFYQKKPIAKTVAAQYSPVLSTHIGLALFDADYAYAGLTFEGSDGRKITTISMPPFTAKSLTVRLDEL
jgi:aminomethyltransferase